MEKPLTLSGHLEELRKRIIVVLIAVGITTVFSLPFASFLLKALKQPAAGLIDKLAFFGPQEAFLIYIRISFFCGLIISMPVILYQLFAFVAPAIEERIKRQAGIFVFFCSIFFISGCLFAYFILIPPALRFLLSFAKDDLEPVISAGKYISFIASLVFASGLVFQMPVLSFIFTKLGIINSRILRGRYKYALVVILIVAAVITPTPDAFNMLMIAVPMLFLYEFSIWVSYFARPKLA